MPETNGKAKREAKVARHADLPAPKVGCQWDTVGIGIWDFPIQVPLGFKGMAELSTEEKSAQLYSRALRIDAPAKLDARARLKKAKTSEEQAKVAEAIAAELIGFDVMSIRTRGPRKPPSVTLDPKKKSYSGAEVAELLKAAGWEVK